MDKHLKKIKDYGEVKENVSFTTITTYKIGGIAKIVCYPFNLDNLIKLLKYLKRNKIAYKIWGRGSNIIPSDKEYQGVIIKLDNLNKIDIRPRYVIVGSGVNLMMLSNMLCNAGLAGLEFACGIPGTIGGAVYMNAGAYNKAMSDVLISIKVLDKDYDIVELSNKELEFSYRHSLLQDVKDYICVEAKIRIVKTDKFILKKLVDERKERRESSQPLNYPSAGSVFRNPPELFAGKLIEDANLKGKKIGGAMISEKHANFVVNTGNAKAQDVKELINLIQKDVKEKFDIELKAEQEFFNWE